MAASLVCRQFNVDVFQSKLAGRLGCQTIFAEILLVESYRKTTQVRAMSGCQSSDNGAVQTGREKHPYRHIANEMVANRVFEGARDPSDRFCLCYAKIRARVVPMAPGNRFPGAPLDEY